MASQALVPGPTTKHSAKPLGGSGRRPSDFRFDSLVIHEAISRTTGLSTTVATSFLLHGALVVALLVIPILLHEALPEPGAAVRAFFVAPTDMAPPPPPPPPPPAASVTRIVKPQATQPQIVDTNRLIAPIDVPDQIKEQTTLDLGVEGGVAGGVEGGVPGGVVGGVVGGLPSAPAPPAHVIRIGGSVNAPKLLKKVAPDYPELAKAARITGVVVIEAHVGVDGRVLTAEIERGTALLNDAALAAVRQWRYKPLLLNGEPTEFILTVTVNFSLSGAS